jgi:hypothetical protein
MRLCGGLKKELVVKEYRCFFSLVNIGECIESLIRKEVGYHDSGSEPVLWSPYEIQDEVVSGFEKGSN